MPFRWLHEVFGRRALGRLLGHVVLDDLIIAARAAHRLAQLEILLHGQLLEAGQEDVLRGFSKSFFSASRSFSLSDFFFMLDLLRQICLALNARDVQVDARAHGGADGHALDVLALGRRQAWL